MTSYNNIFGGAVVTPAYVAYQGITLTTSITMAWPTDFQTALLVVSQIMNVTATVGSLSITLPNATNVSVGTAFLMVNVGSNSFTVKANDGSTLAILAASNALYFYLTDNTTAAGTWSSTGWGSGGGGFAGVTSIAIASANTTALAVSGSPITSTGTITLTPGAELDGLAGLSSNGIVVRTGVGTYTTRSLAVGSSNLTITNPSGVAGNPTYDLATALTGLTSINVGNLQLSGDTITTTDTNGNLILAANGSGLIYANNILAIRGGNPLRWYNTANTQYVAYQAGTLSGNTTWTLPTADASASGYAITSNGSAVLSYQPLYKRNYLMNANMMIFQRGTSFALTGGAVSYTLDRWAAYTTNSSVATISQINPATNGFQYMARIQRNAASADTNPIQFLQVEEQINSIPLQSQTVTLSYYARAGANYSAASSQLRVYVAVGTGANQTPLQFINGSWTGQAVLNDTNQVITTSLTRYSVSFTCTASMQQIGVMFQMTPTGTAGANDYFDIVGIQLELGSIMTPLVFLPSSKEYEDCQHYYWKSFLQGIAPAQNTGSLTGALQYIATVAAGNRNAVNVIFPTVMHMAPTITFYNPSANNAKWRNLTGGADSGAASASNIGESGFLAINAQAAGDGLYDLLAIHVTADAEF